jgi:hypothetical protein
MAVVLFHKAARRLPDGPPDPNARINAYKVSLAPERWAHEGLFDETGLNLAEALERRGSRTCCSTSSTWLGCEGALGSNMHLVVVKVNVHNADRPAWSRSC